MIEVKSEWKIRARYKSRTDKSKGVTFRATDTLALGPIADDVREAALPVFKDIAERMAREARNEVHVLTGNIQANIKYMAYIQKKSGRVVAALKTKSGDGVWPEIGTKHAQSTPYLRPARDRFIPELKHKMGKLV